MTKLYCDLNIALEMRDSEFKLKNRINMTLISVRYIIWAIVKHRKHAFQK